MLQPGLEDLYVEFQQLHSSLSIRTVYGHLMSQLAVTLILSFQV